MDIGKEKEGESMKIRIGKRRKIQFTDKKHPLMGIISMLIAILSFVLMIALFIGSGIAKGSAGIMYGYLGIFNLLLSGVGFVLSLRCYKLEEIYITTPRIGSVLNGFIIIIYLILYFAGAL